MRTTLKIEGLKCPICGNSSEQRRNGHRKDGVQIYKCNCCKHFYVLEMKRYSEDIKQQAIKAYYSGLSGRAVGKLIGMNKANVFRWIKKTSNSNASHYR